MKNKYNNKFAWITGAIVALIIVAIVMISSNRGDAEALTLRSNGSDSNNALATGVDGTKLVGDGDYDYTEAVDHIGEKATVTGTVQKVFTSKSGTVFFDFCDDFATCPFSAVIFAGDAGKFKDLSQYERKVKISGLIKSYQGKAEIVINSREQIQ